VSENTSQARLTGRKREIVLALDRWIYRVAKRWLVLFNLGIGLYLLLPILAPVLTAGSAPRIGQALYRIYRPACHQLPERSVFLFGPKLIYSLEELHRADLISEQAGNLERQRFLGAPGIGLKVALCQRDLALYGSMLVAGLAFGLHRALHPKRPLRPLRLWVFGLALVPMIVDGGTQLLMLRESTWLLRVVTGTLTGVACVWLLYPHLNSAFEDLRRQANKRVHLEPES
jgi:uncharacterized membrane protein